MSEEKEENIYDRIRREAREKREKEEAEQKRRDDFFNPNKKKETSFLTRLKNVEITLQGDR